MARELRKEETSVIVIFRLLNVILTFIQAISTNYVTCHYKILTFDPYRRILGCCDSLVLNL